VSIFVCFSAKLTLCGIVVVLYPWHKLKYFKGMGWEPEWIVTARDIIRAEFDRSYAARPESVEDEQDKDIEMSRNHTTNIFDDLLALSAPRIRELRDELDRYLGTDPEHVIDVLMWWTERKSMYPHLSHMALDYLSIPGELIYII
jgi:hAT family C-terminal dimerisation region